MIPVEALIFHQSQTFGAAVFLPYKSLLPRIQQAVRALLVSFADTLSILPSSRLRLVRRQRIEAQATLRQLSAWQRSIDRPVPISILARHQPVPEVQVSVRRTLRHAPAVRDRTFRDGAGVGLRVLDLTAWGDVDLTIRLAAYHEKYGGKMRRLTYCPPGTLAPINIAPEALG